ncbi:MAG: DUF5668 domain-containing protein [Candidatus Promineifilaceae bacterium]
MSTITHKHHHRPSLFGPIVLIAIGLFFLFNRTDIFTDLHWGDVFSLWPLFLIFAGLNILVLQAPRPFGTVLSGIVALVAVLFFGFVLVNGLPGSIFHSAFSGNWQTEEVSYPAAGLTSAVLEIEIGPPGAEMYALEDSGDLIAGTVIYHDGLLYDKRGGNNQVTITLKPRNTGALLWSPGQWNSLDTEDRWQLGLNPNIPLSLDLTAAAGSSELDFRELLLEDLSLNISAGEMTLYLPGGDYNADLETNAATTTLTLPESGQQKINLQVNAGSVIVELPTGMEARVEAQQALGNVDNQNRRLQNNGNNIWQTAGYENSANRVDLYLNIAVGAVTIR